MSQSLYIERGSNMFSRHNQSTWSKASKLMILAVLCLVVLAACGKDDPEPTLTFSDIESEVVVATYTDGTVTDKEFEKFKAALALSQGMDKSLFEMEGYRDYVLEQYVVYKHIASQATDEVKSGALDESKVQLNTFKDYISQAGYDFEEMTTEYGVTSDDMSTFFYLGSTVSAHLNSLITTEDLSAEYNGHLADYSTYDVRHILIGNEITSDTGEVTSTRTEEEVLALANEAKAKLDAGESWETVAQTYSEDPGSKANGGLYANTKGMNWEENFKQAAFTQEVGVIGEPVKSQFGYHVMLVEKRDTPAFDQLDDAVLDELRYYLSNDKFAELYDTQIEALNVQLSLPPLESGTEEAAPEGTDAPAGETSEETNEETNDDATEETTP